MLIYQGFSASQGCPKNIFRQNPLHPFSVLWISYRPRVRFAATAGYIFLPRGEAYSMHPLDLRVADEDEPSHVSGRLRANIPSFGLVIRRRPAKLLWGLKVEWMKSRQLLRCHLVVQRFFRSQGGGLRPPVAPGTRRPVSFAPRQTLVSSYKSQTAHSTASGTRRRWTAFRSAD